MGLKDHAMREFKAAGWINADGKFECETREKLCKGVLKLLDVFYEEHIQVDAVSMFTKLANYELLVPLSGKDDEWNEVHEGVFQNNRCSHVFKQADRFNGQAYDINGKIFRKSNGSCFTSSDSFVPVEFPYMPKREYVDVERSNET